MPTTMKLLWPVSVMLCVSTVARGDPDGGIGGRQEKRRERTCSTAADCKGILPKICRVCGNGGQQCAHFVCRSGQCEVATCE